MKLYYLFLLVMFLLTGCTNSSNVSGPNVIGTSKMHGNVYVYTIDGHEYIKMGYGFAHSGTCKKCKEELDSIVRKTIREESTQW